MRWCLRGRMTCQSCSRVTQRGSPKYVCDHLWIWLVKVPKMIRQKTKHSQGYSCSRASAGWGERVVPAGPHSCHEAGPPPAWPSPLAPGQLPGLLPPSPMVSGKFSLPSGSQSSLLFGGQIMGVSIRNSYKCGLWSLAELGSGPCSDISWLHELGSAALPL